jgi:serine phosphatase RsbU (regulator of sigma subunit)/anti-sigma regulatory factor (Ser/Thr protein kinase)
MRKIFPALSRAFQFASSSLNSTAMTASPVRCDHRISLRVEAACEFTAVRAAVSQVTAWLAEKGLTEIEIGSWELALVEAANNAVKYADEQGRAVPVALEISAGERDIEARITDHTAGFDWPTEIKLPEENAERGRGLYLMKSLSDELFYLRHPCHNELVLRRRRPQAGNNIFPDAAQLQQRLHDAETALTDMTSELSTSYESLVALFRYSSALGTQTDLQEFAQRLLHDLVPLAEADGAVLRFISRDGRQLETQFILPDRPADSLPPVVLAEDFLRSVEARAARSKQDAWFSPEEPLDAKDPLRSAMPVGTGICHAFFVADQLVGTATLGRLAANKPFTAAQVNLLHTFVDFLAIQMVNARLLDERTASRVTRRELEIAADIQRSLLPAHLPSCPPLTLAASCQSALKVGGDYFDAIPTLDGAVLLVIADVMGKGVPAALFAAVLRSTIRSLPQFYNQPGELLTMVNRILYPDLARVNMFITAAVAYVSPQRAEVSFASAGHCPWLVVGGKTPGKFDHKSGLPLGIEPKVLYPQNKLAVPAGSAALLHTDGLTEMRNGAGELLGDKKLFELLSEVAGRTQGAAMAKNLLLERLAAYRNGAPLADDETFILIRN